MKRVMAIALVAALGWPILALGVAPAAGSVHACCWRQPHNHAQSGQGTKVKGIQRACHCWRALTTVASLTSGSSSVQALPPSFAPRARQSSAFVESDGATNAPVRAPPLSR